MFVFGDWNDLSNVIDPSKALQAVKMSLLWNGPRSVLCIIRKIEINKWPLSKETGYQMSHVHKKVNQYSTSLWASGSLSKKVCTGRRKHLCCTSLSLWALLISVYLFLYFLQIISFSTYIYTSFQNVTREMHLFPQNLKCLNKQNYVRLKST